MRARKTRRAPLPAILLSTALLLAVLPGIRGDRAHGDEGRLVLGVTVSGHIMLHTGWEQFFADDLSWRAELYWAPAFTPNGGWEIAVRRRWTDGDIDPRGFVTRDNAWTLSAGFLQLWAREDDGQWRHLSLPTLAPGHRWGLDGAGHIGLEAPVCWFLSKRRIMPIGFMLRWQPE